MATKQYYATGDFRYGTRMMRAGDGPIAMTGPQARLYTALGKISPNKPKAKAPVEGKVHRGGIIEDAGRLTERPIPAPSKRAPRKRKAAAKKK